jgi:hypothetical protein
MTLLQFMSDSPFLTFFSIVVICSCLEGCARAFFGRSKKAPVVPDCCQCEIKRMADHLTKRK